MYQKEFPKETFYLKLLSIDTKNAVHFDLVFRIDYFSGASVCLQRVHMTYVTSSPKCFLLVMSPICFPDLPKIVSVPSSRQVVEGNGAILFCNATGNPEPNITWSKRGNNTVLSAFEILNLTNLMRGDNGAEYKCRVENYLASVEASAVVTVFCEYFSNVRCFFFIIALGFCDSTSL